MGLPINANFAEVDLPRALVCDHDRESVSLLQSLLSKSGYLVVHAANSSEVSEILHQAYPPKIVIIEISMDSIDLCRALRAEPGDYYPYVLMTAGNDDKAVGELALHSGADDVLPKPFDSLGVLARLSVARRILDLQDGLILAREELRIRATRDSLTDLFNRAAFLDLFQRELDRAGRSRSHTGFLLVDLDHFKNVNDAYGHSAGDEVLREVARRLKHTVRSYDFVGRYGGEEFCIVLPNCPEIDLRQRADAIRLAFGSEPILVGGAKVSVSASVGAIVVFANARSVEETIAVADVALYRAKHSGRNCTVCCRRPLLKESIGGQDLKMICAGCDPRYSGKCLTHLHSTKVPSDMQFLRSNLPISGAFDL